MKPVSPNQLEITFLPIDVLDSKTVSVERIRPHQHTPNDPIDRMLNEHGLDAVAQGFLRVLQPGDEVEVCRKLWKVTARSKDGKRLTIAVDNEKPLIIQERFVDYVVSRERGQEIRCQPHWIWDSRETGLRKKRRPIINRLLRDIESELLAYIHTVQLFRRTSAFVDVLKRLT